MVEWAVFVRRIETTKLQENEKFLESGGLDTPSAKNASGCSTADYWWKWEVLNLFFTHIAC